MEKKIKFKLNGEVVLGTMMHNLGHGRFGVLYDGHTYNVHDKDIVKESDDWIVRQLKKRDIHVSKDFISVPSNWDGSDDLSRFARPIIKRMF